MKIQQLITEALSLPNNAISYHVSQELAAIYPQKILLESNDNSFNLEKYAEANLCKLEYDAHIHNQMITGWNGMENEIYKYTENASFEVLWQGYKFASYETYADYGVPWKRGILFTGSPGNGKTHTVKALINQLHQPCLYVKSLKSEYATDSENIRRVFKQARQSAPCILVLEDIDSLLNDENRSFFLNELDGFASNQGIVTIATTNHPERLDSAIRDRPSRFDRKYHFDLPAIPERQAYITLWNDKLKTAMRLSDEAVNYMVALTDGFSFAYLKELFLSSMVRWMGEMETGALEKIMISQIAVLREQMNSITVSSEGLEKSNESPSISRCK